MNALTSILTFVATLFSAANRGANSLDNLGQIAENRTGHMVKEQKTLLEGQQELTEQKVAKRLQDEKNSLNLNIGDI